MNAGDHLRVVALCAHGLSAAQHCVACTGDQAPESLLAAAARIGVPVYRQGPVTPGRYRQVLRWNYECQRWIGTGVSWRPTIDPRQV